MEEEVSKADCQKKAAELGFDLTKQFLSLAFAGIAFVVGLSFSTPGAVSSLMMWLVIGSFGLSVGLGFYFLMHGVGKLNSQHTFDIYASSLRIISALQIAMMLIGTVLLLPIVARRQVKKDPAAAASIEIKAGPQQGLVYPIDRGKNLVIELDNGKVKVTETNPNGK